MVVICLFQACKWPVGIISGKIFLQQPCLVGKSNQGCNMVVLSCKHGCNYDLGYIINMYALIVLIETLTM